MRGGKTVFSEARTLDGEKAARAWLDRIGARLAEPGGIETAKNRGITLADAIDRRLAEAERTFGATKARALRAIRAHDLAAMPCASIRSEHIVAFASDLAAIQGNRP